MIKMESLKFILRPVYRSIIPNPFLVELGKELKDCKSVLDLGCGLKSPISNFPKTFYAEGVEIYKPYIEQSKKMRIHDKYHNINILDIGKKFKPKSFDCVLALSIIEHLDKDESIKLIKLMERIAKKKIIIEAPNGFIEVTHSDWKHLLDNNPHLFHKSGWSINEMEDLGFKVNGISGFKFLKCGSPKQIKWKPWIFWKFISDISALLLKNKPELSFELFCTKNLMKPISER